MASKGNMDQGGTMRQDFSGLTAKQYKYMGPATYKSLIENMTSSPTLKPNEDQQQWIDAGDAIAPDKLTVLEGVLADANATEKAICNFIAQSDTKKPTLAEIASATGFKEKTISQSFQRLKKKAAERRLLHKGEYDSEYRMYPRLAKVYAYLEQIEMQLTPYSRIVVKERKKESKPRTYSTSRRDKRDAMLRARIEAIIEASRTPEALAASAAEAEERQREQDAFKKKMAPRLARQSFISMDLERQTLNDAIRVVENDDHRNILWAWRDEVPAPQIAQMVRVSQAVVERVIHKFVEGLKNPPAAKPVTCDMSSLAPIKVTTDWEAVVFRVG